MSERDNHNMHNYSSAVYILQKPQGCKTLYATSSLFQLFISCTVFNKHCMPQQLIPTIHQLYSV